MIKSEGFLKIKRASIHLFCEFHNRDAKFGITVFDRGFDRGRATVFREKRGVDIEDAEWFEEIKKAFFDENAEGGENGREGFIAFLKGLYGFEIGASFGVKNDVVTLGERF